MFVAVEAILPRRRQLSLPIPEPGLTSSVVIPRVMYLEDVRSAFHSDAHVRRQASIDAPRMRVVVDGVRCLRATTLNTELLAICTQASLGLPVQLMHASGDVYILEPRTKTPLCVTVASTGDFVVSKDLDVAHGNRETQIRIIVIGMSESNEVVIEFFAHAPSQVSRWQPLPIISGDGAL